MTETKRRVRSYSQLSSYHQCPFAFYLKRIRRLPEPPSVWTAGGLAVHTTTEQYDLLTWQENDLSAFASDAEWRATFRNNFADELDKLRENDPDESNWRTAGKPTKARPNGEDATWWLEAGQDMISRYIAWRISTNDILRIAAVKGAAGIEVEVRTLLGGVEVVGFIDRVFVDLRTLVYLVGDYKSGKRKVTDPGQVGQYSVQLEQQYDLPVTWGAYYSAREGQMGTPLSLTRFTEHQLGEAYQQLEANIAAGHFPPNQTALCKSCGLRKFCPYEGGVLPEETE